MCLLSMMDEREFSFKIKEKGFNLTAQQWDVVRDSTPEILVLAVPGAGKTTALIIRLAYLTLVRKADPKKILCLTFGKAAATEMKERFAQLGDIPIGIQFSTIHSFAYEVARHYYKQHGIVYRIIEEETGANSKTAVLRKINEQLNASVLNDEQLEEVQSAICFTKNTMLEPESIAKQVAVKNFALIYRAYEDYKGKHNPQLLDFDDMLRDCHKALSENPKVLTFYRQKFSHILLDESQDTSLLQFKIVELLHQGNHLFVVGDDDQSIYRFRAAEPSYILDFKKTYPQAKVLRMERNFRSTPEIVDVACKFIRTNKNRYDKQMVTHKGNGAPININNLKTTRDQHHFLVKKLSETKNLSETAILYRNNLSAICLIDELERGGVPFFMKGLTKERFFTHFCINDILNFMRVSFNDRNIQLMERIYTKFNSYIGKTQLEYLRQKADGHRSLFDLLSEQPGLKANRKKDYLQLKSNFKKLNAMGPAHAINYIRKGLGYDEGVGRMCRSLGFSETYIESLLDMLTTIASHQKTLTDFAKRLTYLEELIKSSFINKHANAVVLSTMHSAKGLEWETVYLTDLVEGVIPEAESIKHEEDGSSEPMEEERRLFYVAMTRAKENLYLLTVDHHNGKDADMSRFVHEVSSVIQGKDPCEYKKNAQKNEAKKTAAVNHTIEKPMRMSDFGIGLKVIHKKFGHGVIITEAETDVVIRFKDGEEKTFFKEVLVSHKLIQGG